MNSGVRKRQHSGDCGDAERGLHRGATLMQNATFMGELPNLDPAKRVQWGMPMDRIV
jgi:hypothetical protein